MYTIAQTKGIVSFARVNEIRIGISSSQTSLAYTAGPMEVSGGLTWLASSELRETKLAKVLAAGTVYSVQYFSIYNTNILFVQ